MAARKFFVGVRSKQSERYFRRHYDAGEHYDPPATEDQFIPIQFTLLDNPDFRNGLMTKARFRTYLFLRRYVVRAPKAFDPCFLSDRYWSHGELAASVKLEKLAGKLNLPKSTVSDHIRQLEKDGVIEVDTIEPSEATDNVQHLVFVLGTGVNGQERWFLDEVFSGVKDENFRSRRSDK
jgi:hypothetical protein